MQLNAIIIWFWQIPPFLLMLRNLDIILEDNSTYNENKGNFLAIPYALIRISQGNSDF